MPRLAMGVTLNGALLLCLLVTREISSIYLSTKIVRTKFGQLRGTVVTPNNRNLRDVEVFLGVPYAAPPVGPLRFMPPTTQKEWTDVKEANEMPPVCPQKWPDVTNRRDALKKMSLGRFNYLQRLIPHLRRQSEDCLYLNIYAPIRDPVEGLLPVMLYIHGESYEWNSGNPYDGTVLASYGRVVVITVNYRLGILGFLRHSLSQRTVSNFGLLDQNSALHWIKENIKNFGGDPDNVTIFGHGTGATLANLLLLSPITSKEGSIKRAILMSGTALSRWAVTTDPYKYTIQVAKALKCPVIYEGDELANCLREKSVEELLAVPIQAPPFTTPLGPIVDDIVIKRDSRKEENIDISMLGKYDLLYGVTSAECFNILTSSEVEYGMSEERKNRLLRAYISNTFDHQTSVIYAAVSNEYKSYGPSPNEYSISGLKKDIRDQALQILSDAQIVAPVINMGDVHSGMNSKSYLYVFNHQSIYGGYPHSQGTVHGEELAYVFGAPLVDGFGHFDINYTFDEQFLSELVMTLWTNFAKTGNPNLPAPQRYLTEGATFNWDENLKKMWPAYDGMSQQYLNIDMQVLAKLHYRAKKLDVWNHFIPSLISSTTMPMEPVPQMPTLTSLYLVPTVPSHFPLPFTSPPYQPPPTFKSVPSGTESPPHSMTHLEQAPSPPADAGTPMSVVIVIGLSILFFNCFAMAGIYYKRDKLRFDIRNCRRGSKKSEDSDTKEADTPEIEDLLSNSNDDNKYSDNGFSESPMYPSSQIPLTVFPQSASEKDDSMNASTATLPKDTTKLTKPLRPLNEHRRNKSENSIYIEVGSNSSKEDIYKKNSVKFEKGKTLPSKLMTKSTTSITSIKSSSSRASIKSSTSHASGKSNTSVKPLKKNASVQSLPTSEYGWGITKEMTMNRDEPEGRDDKQTTDSQQQVADKSLHKNYPKVLPEYPIVITESSSLLRNPNRPYPPPRSTSLTSHDFEELENTQVVYRNKKVPRRDASTDSYGLNDENSLYGVGSKDFPAPVSSSSSSVASALPTSTATVRRSSGVYGHFQPAEIYGQPKIPLPPQAPLSPNIHLSRTKGGPFITFGKGEQSDTQIYKAQTPISTPIILATSSVTSLPQPTYGMRSSPSFGSKSPAAQPIYDKFSNQPTPENSFELNQSSEKIFLKKPNSKKPILSGPSFSKDKPLKSVLKQTSVYDKPKNGSSSSNLSSSASINMSNAPNSGSSNSSSNSSIYFSKFTSKNSKSPK